MSSKTIHLAYGRQQFPVEVPTSNLLGVLAPLVTPETEDEHTIIKAALNNPIGAPALREIVQPGQTVAIVTSDLTRPCPSDRLLPYILDELHAAGIPDEAIFIVLATGIHRKMTDDEIEKAVGAKVKQRVRVLNHDLTDTICLGTTPAGTPVEIFRPLTEADVRICLGNVEYHYFAGYSGGAKAIFPGCASKAAVIANHTLMVHPKAATGHLEDNPLRKDLEQAVAMLGVDFILNVVVDGQHRIIAAVAGDVTAAHRKGCEFIAARSSVKIPGRADIVLASSGGFPKDINMLQAHKGLDKAANVVRQGGIIIWVAECAEGFGNHIFETWMKQADSPAEIIEKIQRKFVLGGHKAAAMATIQQRASIFMVSSLADETVRRIGIKPYSTPQVALQAAFDVLGAQSSLLVLPQSASILPEID